VNYYPHHIGDYLRDTAHLSPLEDGIYRRMLDVYYASEKPLPLETQWVSRLVRATTEEERNAVDEILRQFFDKHPEGWRNKRADHEIMVAAKKAKVARQNGKLGGRPRTQRVISGLAKPKLAGNPTQSSQNQNQNQNQKKKTSAIALPSWVPEDAWKAWLEVRPKVKAPNTPRALALALRDLERLRDSGNDPRAVLEAATVKGWRGLFPVKQEGISQVGEVI
jgi:uncharacterized protein YdaU (DUF1376 family)